MSRAWPYEGQEDAGPVRSPEQFLERSGEGTEAVVVRIGLNDAQLVLVDGRGAWQRWVYHSVEEATQVAEGLGLEAHVGEYPEELRVRINSYQRPAGDFDRSAYPEQGSVGPVIPYPENRPRRLDVLKKEVAQEPRSEEGS
ncbi:MAG TPA: hypothetical protein VFK89_02380 [Actinomycetota bacterium]|nr:hypothetical protein [Actinomycetota bacterium]